MTPSYFYYESDGQRHRDKAKRDGEAEFQHEEFSATQPPTKPKKVGPLGVCDANSWQGPRRAAPVETPEFCVLQLQEGILRELEDSASFSAGAHGPHRAASFWFGLGSRWLLLVASVRGEVQDTHGLTYAWRLAEIP